MAKTIKVCKTCGKQINGSQDMLYCHECSLIKRTKDVINTRICIDCGQKFEGGPRAKRCPSCRKKPYKKHPTIRPLGSIDKCTICDSEYTVVSGRQKYCSEACQRIGVLAWQRQHKKDYNKKPENIAKKIERRNSREKICNYCGKSFWVSTSTNYCSDYCRKEGGKITQCYGDITRGYNRNLQKYLDARDEYRNQVKGV